MYCKARGLPLPDARDWCFFLSLGLFRLAAIAAGVGARAKLGNASSARAASVYHKPYAYVCNALLTDQGRVAGDFPGWGRLLTADSNPMMLASQPIVCQT